MKTRRLMTCQFYSWLGQPIPLDCNKLSYASRGEVYSPCSCQRGSKATFPEHVETSSKIEKRPYTLQVCSLGQLERVTTAMRRQSGSFQEKDSLSLDMPEFDFHGWAAGGGGDRARQRFHVHRQAE